MVDEKEEFGKRLHRAALDAGFFTRDQLSEELDTENDPVKPRTISEWWAGRTLPRVLTLQRYADVTHKSILYFYDMEESVSDKITISKKEYDKLRDEAAKEKARADQLEKLYNQLLTKGKK